MNKVHAVIGANWGDEGKGLVTDALSRELNNPLIVRFNGGAQAAHTVQCAETNVRYVFGHLGSGTLAGRPTYLSRNYILNPALFRKEWDDCSDLNPTVFVSPFCRVTTHYDMLLNQEIEEARSGHKHGSCGAGIFETIQRNNDPKTQTLIEDFNPEEFINRARRYATGKFYQYFSQYIPEVSKLNAACKDFLHRGANMDNRFVEDLRYFYSKINVVKSENEKDFLNSYKNIIFEGAQGLMLDEDYGDMPYCTPSKTGLKGISDLVSKIGARYIDVAYVSRAYSTRHGAGPLPYENFECFL